MRPPYLFNQKKRWSGVRASAVGIGLLFPENLGPAQNTDGMERDSALG